jgi:hypothetical protein
MSLSKRSRLDAPFCQVHSSALSCAPSIWSRLSVPKNLCSFAPRGQYDQKSIAITSSSHKEERYLSALDTVNLFKFHRGWGQSHFRRLAHSPTVLLISNWTSLKPLKSRPHFEGNGVAPSACLMARELHWILTLPGVQMSSQIR